MECFICGVKGEDAALFSAIMNEGVVPICEECSVKENIPVIKRVGQLRESERNQTIYERLSKMAGLNPVEHKEKINREEKNELRRELRKPVEKNGSFSFPNLKKIQPQFEEGLIRNYHWTIFNARRALKLTQKQLADEIGESEASVKLVERGILPDNYIPFIKKLQTCLGIELFNKPLKKDNLIKETPRINVEEKKEEKIPYWKKLGFLSRNREKRKSEELENEQGEAYKEEKKESTDEMKMLSREEIDRITFEERGED